MKKATIIITIISIVISAIALYTKEVTYLKRVEISRYSDINNYISIEQENIIERVSTSGGSDYQYHYTDIDLNQMQYREVNECMQLFLKNKTFKETDNCQEKIVDVLINERGERDFIKSIVGDMLKYSNAGVYIKYNYVRNLVLSGEQKDLLKKNLILAFINRYRDPTKLQEIYKNHKDFFLSYISKDVYTRVYKNYINSFISSYNEIHSKTDKEAFYKDIYFKAEKQRKESEYWKYTFWKRRELEKNDKIIYTILKEISEYYEK